MLRFTPMKRFAPPVWILALTVFARPAAVRAVIVATGDGTQNTTAPADGAPWGNVGAIGGASGVYLGDYGGQFWVLTAAHVGMGNITLGSTVYTAVGSPVRVLNHDASNADLTLFQISSDPGLPNLPISLSAPVTGAAVDMIGYGFNHAAAQSYWSVDTAPNPWVWTSLGSSAGANDSGYAWGGGSAGRWGVNTIAGTQSGNVGYGQTSWLYTTFSDNADNAQGAVGDSGGAMFYKNGSVWELAGILDAIGTFSGQPSSTAVFGDQTDASDLSVYRPFIISAIPEPAGVALWLGAAALGAALFWRRRRVRA